MNIEKKQAENKKKIDKMQLATRIIAAIMAFLMIGGLAASFVYYLLRTIK